MRNVYEFIKPYIFKICPKTGKIRGINYEKALVRILFPLFGLASVIWFLIRVIPKPSRITYPCMKVATPLASSFLLYLIGLFSTVFALHKAKHYLAQSRILIAASLIFLGIMAGMFTFLNQHSPSYAEAYALGDPLGVNNPIGQAKGINPGRVIWVHDPDATNENCVPDKWGDAYFLDKNCDQKVVDRMLAKALLKLTDTATETEAWEAVFKYFNKTHGKGEVGYRKDETIFIKINAVHAWTTNGDGSIRKDDSYGNVDTSPQAALAMLKQLVRRAGVPEGNIYIGDPYTHIFNHCYEMWRKEFPNIHYMDKNGLDGREKYKASRNYVMQFSDRGQVLSEVQDRYFTVMEEADYILSIPAVKGHRWGGVTLFAKNFFGANTRSGASHMHPGLHRTDYDKPLRGEYRMYRVFVDLMAHENLGGKSLIYFADALWGCSYEHEPPVKFKMAPFNNDWTSSILLSQDPVAIASVCLDLLQAEFPKTESEEPGNYWYPNFPAADDYLHQAADSTWWPKGIKYDPEKDGTTIGSLGTHEHWNNPVERKYSRNLGTGKGIELMEVQNSTAVASHLAEADQVDVFVLQQNSPNPFNPTTTITYTLPRSAKVEIIIYNLQGQRVNVLANAFQEAGSYSVIWNGENAAGVKVPSGVYVYRMTMNDGNSVRRELRRMVLAK